MYIAAKVFLTLFQLLSNRVTDFVCVLCLWQYFLNSGSGVPRGSDPSSASVG